MSSKRASSESDTVSSFESSTNRRRVEAASPESTTSSSGGDSSADVMCPAPPPRSQTHPLNTWTSDESKARNNNHNSKESPVAAPEDTARNVSLDSPSTAVVDEQMLALTGQVRDLLSGIEEKRQEFKSVLSKVVDDYFDQMINRYWGDSHLAQWNRKTEELSVLKGETQAMLHKLSKLEAVSVSVPSTE